MVFSLDQVYFLGDFHILKCPRHQPWLIWLVYPNGYTHQVNFYWIPSAKSVASTSPETTIFRCLSRSGVDFQQWYFSWQNLQEVFAMLVVVFHSLLFLWCWLMFLSFWALSPCHQHSTMASQAREGLHQLWALPWLLSIALLLRHIFKWAFFTRVFYLTLLSHIFTTICFHKDLPGRSGSSSLKFAGLHNDPHNKDPADLYDSQQSTILKFRRIRI